MLASRPHCNATPGIKPWVSAPYRLPADVEFELCGPFAATDTVCGAADGIGVFALPADIVRDGAVDTTVGRIPNFICVASTSAACRCFCKTAMIAMSCNEAFGLVIFWLCLAALRATESRRAGRLALLARELEIPLGGNGCGLRSSAPFPVPVPTPPVKHGRTLPSPIATRTSGLTCACASDWQLAGEKSNCLFEELIRLMIADSGTPPFTRPITSASVSVDAPDGPCEW